MIKVSISSEKIIIKGHANFADYGKDIVCASASSIVITSINLCLRMDKESIKYDCFDNKLIIEIIKNSENIKLVMENMLAMLEELADTYPKNIKIIKEEKLWISWS